MACPVLPTPWGLGSLRVEPNSGSASCLWHRRHLCAARSCTCTRPFSRSGHRLCPHFHTRPHFPSPSASSVWPAAGRGGGETPGRSTTGTYCGRERPSWLPRPRGSFSSVPGCHHTVPTPGRSPLPSSPRLPTSSTESSRPGARGLGKTQEPAVALGLPDRALGLTSGDSRGQVPSLESAGGASRLGPRRAGPSAGSSVGAKAGGSRSRPVPGSLTRGWRWLRR